MNISKIFRVIVSLALVILTCVYAYAMPGEGHKNDWGQVFGISGGKVDNVWSTAQNVIDRYETDYKTLQKKFEWFRLGSARHRLLFHWGFNTPPDKHVTLVKQVDDCFRGRSDASEQKEKFFAALNKINNQRKAALTLSISTNLGLVGSQAIAGIIHDVHILGDYTTTNKDGLAPISDIQRDLKNNFGDLLGYRPSEKLINVQREFNEELSRAGSSGDDATKARNLIATAKKFVPVVINERFGNTLKQKGIYVKTTY